MMHPREALQFCNKLNNWGTQSRNAMCSAMPVHLDIGPFVQMEATYRCLGQRQTEKSSPFSNVTRQWSCYAACHACHLGRGKDDNYVWLMEIEGSMLSCYEETELPYPEVVADAEKLLVSWWGMPLLVSRRDAWITKAAEKDLVHPWLLSYDESFTLSDMPVQGTSTSTFIPGTLVQHLQPYFHSLRGLRFWIESCGTSTSVFSSYTEYYYLACSYAWTWRPGSRRMNIIQYEYNDILLQGRCWWRAIQNDAPNLTAPILVQCYYWMCDLDLRLATPLIIHTTTGSGVVDHISFLSS